jgi:copper chaperone CopZ
MNTEKIYIANLKCGGCATTITNELSKLKGVSKVLVDNESDSVNISYENIDRKKIIDKLHELGYPEATEENGLILQLKSYGSCMIGRIHNITHK